MAGIPNRVLDHLHALLGVRSMREVAESLLTRTRLPGGRFEAHQLGLGQHSSSAAGAVLTGLAGIPALPDALLAPVVADVGALVDDTGAVRGHDADAQAGVSSWSSAQVLLGLTTRPALAAGLEPRLVALAGRLLAVQDAGSGGWPLRVGEEAGVPFTFYPAIALARAARLDLLPPGRLAAPLARVAGYLADAVRAGRGPLEEQLLAVRALELLAAADRPAPPDLAALTATVHGRSWPVGQGLQLQDRSVVGYRQPTWNAVLWRPLLYLAVRGGSPANPLPAQLGHELVTSYDRRIGAWRGPALRAPAAAGVSWASAMALRATYWLARDLVRFELTAEQWLDRCREIQSDMFDFDVAISFAAADRQIAQEISAELKQAGYRVFYDRDYQHALLGEDLAAFLHETYFRRSRFAVVLVSPAFLASNWAGNWEWRAVLARMQQQNGAYLLPYILEDVTVPGLGRTLGYASQKEYSTNQFAELVVRKLREVPRLP
ncbi:MAG TPA: toll/interleukin-1 receptor domain-containing protein [Mycobacteriales bacterium]|nr:toll/interleukin-1 receptor domain-containing protein [Mycobacteriales bacterium]